MIPPPLYAKLDSALQFNADWAALLSLQPCMRALLPQANHFVP